MSQRSAWFPTILDDKCDGCANIGRPRCVQFCPHEVLGFRDGKAIVVNPQNCVDGCVSCQMLCPRKAIIFPRATTSLVREKVKDKVLLRKARCQKCGKIFWTNRETNLCFDCER